MILIKSNVITKSTKIRKLKVLSTDKTQAEEFFDQEALEDAKKHWHRDLSREHLFYMKVNDFLNLAQAGHDAAKERTVQLLLRDKIPLESIPYLKVENKGKSDMDDSAKEWVVTGHEGRHRARALQSLGIDIIPVMITHNTMRWGKAKNRPVKVWAQEPKKKAYPYKSLFQE